MPALTRNQIAKLLSEHYTAKFGAMTQSTYDHEKRAYEIYCTEVPTNPDLVKDLKYPTTCTILDWIKPAKAREIVKGMSPRVHTCKACNGTGLVRG